MTRAKTIVSGGVVLYLNGKPFGRVTSFSYSSTSPRKEIYGLDSTEPFELMPTTTQCSGRIGLIRTVGDGGAEGAGMTVQYGDLPREKYFKLQLVERVSDTILFEANYCSVQSQSWAVGSKSAISGEVDFKALDWSNELKSRT